MVVSIASVPMYARAVRVVGYLTRGGACYPWLPIDPLCVFLFRKLSGVYNVFRERLKLHLVTLVF
jgi:hypothetical protein